MTTMLAVSIYFILALLTIFQILLIMGLPLGRFAWGGQNKVLPPKLRISSLSSILIYFGMSLIALSAGEIIDLGTWTDSFGIWTLTGYFFLGVILNALSLSKSEKIVMAPVALVLFLLSFILSLSQKKVLQIVTSC